MNPYLVQHLFRAWRKHWVLQLASVTVMTLVLVLLNFLFLGYSLFNNTLQQWGRGLEMIVYLKENVVDDSVSDFQKQIESSGQFEQVKWTPKAEATRRFLASLGPDSLDLMKDPKWNSPIPASFELRLSANIPLTQRVEALQGWSAKFKAFEFVDDVFYGQGWVENFTKFLSSAQGFLIGIWILGLAVGLLIVSNCIRLSFWQRRQEIEILELVGATRGFVRTPFLLEGVTLGLCASLLSIGLSSALHLMILKMLTKSWSFWIATGQIPILSPLSIAANLVTALAFGYFGAWNCVRKINTGWSAAVAK